jgi:hypothetical protein
MAPTASVSYSSCFITSWNVYVCAYRDIRKVFERTLLPRVRNETLAALAVRVDRCCNIFDSKVVSFAGKVEEARGPVVCDGALIVELQSLEASRNTRLGSITTAMGLRVMTRRDGRT